MNIVDGTLPILGLEKRTTGPFSTASSAFDSRGMRHHPGGFNVVYGAKSIKWPPKTEERSLGRLGGMMMHALKAASNPEFDLLCLSCIFLYYLL